MSRLLLPVGMLGLCLLAACSGRGALRCVDSSRYLASASIPPLRVPDALSVPDESRALRIPGASGPAPEPRERGNCLEAPPDFLSGVEPEQAAE